MKKSGFTRSDYSQFLRLRDAGVFTEAISQQLKITETCIARAVANLEPPKPAQKGQLLEQLLEQPLQIRQRPTLNKTRY